MYLQKNTVDDHVLMYQTEPVSSRLSLEKELFLLQQLFNLDLWINTLKIVSYLVKNSFI